MVVDASKLGDLPRQRAESRGEMAQSQEDFRPLRDLTAGGFGRDALLAAQGCLEAGRQRLAFDGT